MKGNEPEDPVSIDFTAADHRMWKPIQSPSPDDVILAWRRNLEMELMSIVFTRASNEPDTKALICMFGGKPIDTQEDGK